MDLKSGIFIWKGGERKGPFSPKAIADAVRLGSIVPETPAWTGSDPTWRSVAELLKRMPQTTEPVIPPTSRPAGSGSAQDKKPVITADHSSSLKIGMAAVGLAGILLFGILAYRSGNTTGNEISRPDSTRGAADSENGADGQTSNHPTPGIVRWAVSIEEAEKCVLMARGSEGSAGSAFYAMDGGRTYVYTNVHVASYESLEFSDFRGRVVRVAERGEAVESSLGPSGEGGIDIVRFPTFDTPEYALRLAGRDVIEKKPDVWALGDSGGEKILKTLKGRINGVGPTKIEVDCEFIQGNSGGPIVTSEGEVVGIASYMTSDRTIWARGTENEIRRIAWIPRQQFRWIKASAAELAKERSLVDECLRNYAMLAIVLMLEIHEDGLSLPKDLDEEVNMLLAFTERHPLRESLLETTTKITGLARIGASKQEKKRAAIHFLESCASYHEQQLEMAEREVRSSFWKQILLDGGFNYPFGLNDYKEFLIDYSERLRRYRESAWAEGSWSDS